jgi:DNA-binding NarL/FixJ family response regulator
MADARTTIVILDASETARRGLRALLHEQPDLHVVADCASARDACNQVARFAPRVVVMDFVLPDASGPEACRLLRAQASALRVLALLSQVDGRAVMAAVRAGAVGIVSKRAPLAEITAAVRAVAAGVSRLDAATTAALVEQLRHDAAGVDGDDTLTEEEHRLLVRVAAGRTNKEIARELGVSEKSVKTRLSRAFAKLGVTRRARAAVVFAADGAVRDAPTSAPDVAA